VLHRQELALQHFLHRRRLLQAVADEAVLALVADAPGVPGVADEVVGELLLLADAALDGAHALPDAHLALDAAFLFALEQAHGSPFRYAITRITQSRRSATRGCSSDPPSSAPRRRAAPSRDTTAPAPGGRSPRRGRACRAPPAASPAGCRAGAGRGAPATRRATTARAGRGTP